MRNKYLFALMAFLLIGFVYAIPLIDFVLPTLNDSAVTSNTYVAINISITEANLNEVKYNWNGTNYTYYNDSLVLMYNFDNVSALGENNTKVVDVSKYGNNGTIYGAVWNATGKYNGGFDFNGAGDYVNISNKINFSSNDFTVGAWVKSGGTAQASIISNYDYVKWFVLGFNEDGIGNPVVGKVGFGIDDDTTKKGKASTASTYNDNKWHYVVGKRDGTNIELFVDGISQGTTAIGSYGSIESSITPKVGRYGDAITKLDFNGSIDEVRIWNRSLSAVEIYQQYVANLNKYDTNKWLFYVNQSKNVTDGLDKGNYTYYGCATNTTGNENCTGIRTITLSDPLAINLTSPFNNQEIIRGSGSYTGEDSLGVVPDSINLTAKIYYNPSFEEILGATCYFYENSSLLGEAETNSSGDCYYSYNKASEDIGIKEFLVNYSYGGYPKAIETSSVNISLTKYITSLSVGNLRDNGKYYDGDTAVLNIDIKKSNASVTDEQYNPQNISVEIMNSADELRGYLSYPENLTKIGSGVYQANLTVDYGAGSDEFIKWEVKLSDDGFSNYLGSSLEADKTICSADFGDWSAWTTCSGGSQTRTRTDATGCSETESQSCSVSEGSTGGGGCTSECTRGDIQNSCESSSLLKEKTCGNYDTDSCYEWSPFETISCSSGEVCSLGECVENPTNNESDSNWKCGEWSKCEATYTIVDAIKGNSPEGTQERECENSDSGSNKTELQSCDFRIPITVSSKEICGKKYVLIYSKETGQLLSKLDFEKIENYQELMRLNLQFVPDENAECDKTLELIDYINWAFWIRIFLWILFVLLLVLLSKEEEKEEETKQPTFLEKEPIKNIIPAHEDKLARFTRKEWLAGMFKFSGIKEKLSRRRYLPKDSLRKLIDKKVYTNEGGFVGRVVEAHLEGNKIAKLMVRIKGHKKLRGITFSYSHVKDVGEVVIINDKILDKIS